MEQHPPAPTRGCEIDPDLVIEVRAYLVLRRLRMPEGPELAQSWDRFFAVCDPLVRRFARSRGLRDADASDCAHDVWQAVIRVLSGGGPGPDPGRLGAWFFGMVRHKAADVARHRGRAAPGDDEAFASLPDPRACDPAVELDREWIRAEVREVVAGLVRWVSAESCRVLHLRWFEGRAFAEIADELGITPPQARVRHHRVIARLRLLIGAGRAGGPAEFAGISREFAQRRGAPPRHH
jgi:RNA polymerase sigma factor (sigma-70 family)